MILDSAGMGRRGLGPVYFAVNGRIELLNVLPLLPDLSQAGVDTTVVAFADRNRIEERQLEKCRETSRLKVLKKGLGYRIMGRIRRDVLGRPPESRRVSWARRFLRAIGGPDTAGTVVTFLSCPTLFRWKKGPRLLCLQTEPITNETYFGQEENSPALSSVSRFLVWGPRLERKLRSWGVESPIVVVGSPRMTKEKVVPPVGEGLRVLYATQPSPCPIRKVASTLTPAMKEWAMLELCKCLTGRAVSQITIKLHPMDHGRVESRLMEESRSSKFRLLSHLDPGADLESLIRDHDILITFFSAAALEAMALGKPVICLDPEMVSTKALDLVTPGVACRVESDDQLRATLQEWDRERGVKFATFEERRDLFLDDIAALSGQAARSRIVEELIRPPEPTGAA